MPTLHRRAAGSQGSTVYQNAENPNAMTTVLQWDNLSNAQAFVSSDELKETLQNAGVVTAPDTTFVEEAATIAHP